MGTCSTVCTVLDNQKSKGFSEKQPGLFHLSAIYHTMTD